MRMLAIWIRDVNQILTLEKIGGRKFKGDKAGKVRTAGNFSNQKAWGASKEESKSEHI